MKHAIAFVACAVFLASLACSVARAQEKGKWVPLDKSVEVEAKQKDGSLKKESHVISSLAVDRTTGDVLGFIRGSGLWKSSDQGQTFSLIYQAATGRCGSAFALTLDPSNGKRLAVFLDGGPSALTLDGGVTWKPIKQQGLWCNVDWSDPEAKTLNSRYGGHSEWMTSLDQGQTWKPIKGKEWSWPFGLFGPRNWVTNGKETLQFSDDAGATYADVAGPKIVSRVTVMQVFKGTGYFIVKGGLACSKDRGHTWAIVPTPKDPDYGPYFGKDEKHLLMATRNEGFFESTDAGATWKVVTAFPVVPKDVPTQNDHGGLGTAGYDPVHDAFYFCTSGQSPQKYQR